MTSSVSLVFTPEGITGTRFPASTSSRKCSARRSIYGSVLCTIVWRLAVIRSKTVVIGGIGLSIKFVQKEYGEREDRSKCERSDGNIHSKAKSQKLVHSFYFLQNLGKAEKDADFK